MPRLHTWTSKDLPQLCFGGFVATAVMTLVLFPVAHIAAMPIFDFAALLGQLVVSEQVVAFSRGWWLGLLEHFLIGTVVFPMIFAFGVFDRLPGQIPIKGVLWGICLFLAWEVIVMPITGHGFFSMNTPRPIYQIFVSLNTHVLYGAVLGLLSTPAVRRVFRHEHVRVVQDQQAA